MTCEGRAKWACIAACCGRRVCTALLGCRVNTKVNYGFAERRTREGVACHEDWSFLPSSLEEAEGCRRQTVSCSTKRLNQLSTSRMLLQTTSRTWRKAGTDSDSVAAVHETARIRGWVNLEYDGRLILLSDDVLPPVPCLAFPSHLPPVTLVLVLFVVVNNNGPVLTSPKGTLYAA